MSSDFQQEVGTRAEDAQARTVFVSDALQLRVDTYREAQDERTNTSIVFDAIEAHRDELATVLREARVPFVSDSGQTHHLGSGPVRIVIRPTAEQSATLDELTGQLGGETLSDWLPAVLNAHLPGRKEPDNMPWLKRAAPEQRTGE
ncbi:hypothetical protein [Parasphingorhabdus pacifica]